MNGHFDHEDKEALARTIGQNPAHGAQYGNNGGEQVKLDAPFKLARAQLPTGEWLLKIELLHPGLYEDFQKIVQRGANTFDMHELPLLRALVEGIIEVPGQEGNEVHVQSPTPTIEDIHKEVFTKYAAFQKQKEKVMPLPMMKLHMAIGIQGEMLELMQAFELPDTQFRANVIEELGDLLFFVHGIRRHYDLLPFTNQALADSQQRITSDGDNMRLINAVEALANLVKKDVIYEKVIDKSDFYNAVSNVEVCMSVMCKRLGTQMWELARSNMYKLNKRYADKFTTQEAANRADKIEA